MVMSNDLENVDKSLLQLFSEVDLTAMACVEEEDEIK